MSQAPHDNIDVPNLGPYTGTFFAPYNPTLTILTCRNRRPPVPTWATSFGAESRIEGNI